ncbi:hypothetical protein B0T13DRAFT_486582 [Neurospora crassa]|nr:hypothetical protein B0T13DRAFT_486582 [Neurospora crassa]
MDIIVTGAGLSGLSTALSLRRANLFHRITILERSSSHYTTASSSSSPTTTTTTTTTTSSSSNSSKSYTSSHELGAAINVPPNISRFRCHPQPGRGWSLDPLKQKFVKSEGMLVINSQTMEQMGQGLDHSRNEEVWKGGGGALWYAHRVDLHGGVVGEEVNGVDGVDGKGREGRKGWVRIEGGKEAVAFDPSVPSVTLSDNTVLIADLLIAADGVHSRAPEYVLGHPNQPQRLPDPKLNTCYRFLIPTAEIADDPDTKFFLDEDRKEAKVCRLWPDVKGRKRVIAYRCRGETLSPTPFPNIMLAGSLTFKSSPQDWHAPVSKSEVLSKLKATNLKRWPLLYRPPIPSQPGTKTGGAQAIEDGLVLGLCLGDLSSASSPEELERRLQVCDKIRRNRASAIQVMSNVGSDEEAPRELEVYLKEEGWDGGVPKNMKEVIELEYGPDVVERTVKTMKDEVDAGWEVPRGFFPGLR